MTHHLRFKKHSPWPILVEKNRTPWGMWDTVFTSGKVAGFWLATCQVVLRFSKENWLKNTPLNRVQKPCTSMCVRREHARRNFEWVQEKKRVFSEWTSLSKFVVVIGTNTTFGIDRGWRIVRKIRWSQVVIRSYTIPVGEEFVIALKPEVEKDLPRLIVFLQFQVIIIMKIVLRILYQDDPARYFIPLRF